MKLTLEHLKKYHPAELREALGMTPTTPYVHTCIDIIKDNNNINFRTWHVRKELKILEIKRLIRMISTCTPLTAPILFEKAIYFLEEKVPEELKDLLLEALSLVLEQKNLVPSALEKVIEEPGNTEGLSLRELSVKRSYENFCHRERSLLSIVWTNPKGAE